MFLRRRGGLSGCPYVLQKTRMRITPDRTIRVRIYRAYQDWDEDGNGKIDPDETEYGYDIDTEEFTLTIIGNDETNGALVDDGGKCAPVENGATEEGNYNRAPLFTGDPREFEVAENTQASQPIGDPVTADDPEDDTVSYSLTGTDAGSFNINSSTGQIFTKDPLDYETRDTYHLAVAVTDNKDLRGNSNSAEDDSIDVTIEVEDVNEPPTFDSGIPTSLNVVENSGAGQNIGAAITATDPDNDPAINTLTYSLDDGDGAAFGIDSGGQITTKDALWTRKPSRATPLRCRLLTARTTRATRTRRSDDTHQVTITVRRCQRSACLRGRERRRPDQYDPRDRRGYSCRLAGTSAQPVSGDRPGGRGHADLFAGYRYHARIHSRSYSTYRTAEDKRTALDHESSGHLYRDRVGA